VLGITIWTYSNVKLSLESWSLVDKVAKVRNVSLSEALELLIRHGSIRLAEVDPETPWSFKES